MAAMTWEFQFLYWLQAHRTDWLDWLMIKLTAFGNAGIFWILLGFVQVFMVRTRRMGLSVLVSIVIGAVIGNLILKNLIARERPCWIDSQVVLLIENPKDFSFPSGHTMVSFEGAVSILMKNRRWGIAALALACLIAFSRLYLFVHFPTDILFGAALGTAIAAFVDIWIRPSDTVG